MKKFKKKLADRRKRKQEARADSGAPRITNDTVAAHREEVLSSARKYIYPLQHSKHKIVLISASLVIAGFVGLMSYCLVALYRLDGTSTFLYRVTQVVPFPVAKAGPRLVAYENYLFELRHYMYFYEHQQKVDFSGNGKQQLDEYKKRALEKVVNDAYIKQIADEKKVSVSEQEVTDQITILRRQNRLGGSDQAYIDALKQNFGWTTEDFRRVIKEQLLEQKVLSALDTDTHARANAVLAEIKNGGDFGKLAAQHSDEAASKSNNGEFGFPIDKANRDLSPLTTDALFQLQPGQTSEIVNTGYALEILKVIEVNGDKVRAAHISFNFKDINTYLNDLKEKKKARTFITP